MVRGRLPVTYSPIYLFPYEVHTKVEGSFLHFPPDIPGLLQFVKLAPWNSFGSRQHLAFDMRMLEVHEHQSIFTFHDTRFQHTLTGALPFTGGRHIKGIPSPGYDYCPYVNIALAAVDKAACSLFWQDGPVVGSSGPWLAWNEISLVAMGKFHGGETEKTKKPHPCNHISKLVRWQALDSDRNYLGHSHHRINLYSLFSTLKIAEIL